MLTNLFVVVVIMIYNLSANIVLAQTKEVGLSESVCDVSYIFSKLNSDKKERFLLNQIKSGSYSDFLTLLSDANEKEIPCFKKSFLKSDDIKILFAIGEHINANIEKAEQEIIENDTLATINPDEMLLIGKLITDKILLLEPEIKILTKKHVQEIINAIKEATVEADVYSRSKFIGAIIALKSLGEEGFESLLLSIKSEDDANVAKVCIKAMGSDALLPTIDYYEKTDAESYQKLLAIQIIRKIDWNENSVLDKAVEALIECRVYENSSMTCLLTECLSENKNSVNYILGNCISRLQPAEIDLLVLPLCKIDFHSFFHNLKHIDVKFLSNESKLELLSRLCLRSNQKVNENGDLDFRSDLFLKLFLATDANARSIYIFEFESFPSEKMAKFYIDNFNRLSEGEKNAVIQMCDYSLGNPTQFPKKLRIEVYTRVKPMCGEDLKKLINSRLERDKG